MFKYITLALLGLITLGAFCPAFAQEPSDPTAPYTRWEGNKLVVLAERPDYPEVTVLYDLIVAERPDTAAPVLAHRPTTKSERVKWSGQIDQWDPHIAKSAIASGTPAELIKAVMLRESGGVPTAVSPTGAKGLMQFIASTARAMGVTDRFDPVQSIMGGGRYLRQLLNLYEGRSNQLELAIASYNAGPKAVQDAGYRIPPKHETQVFVPNVLKAYRVLITQRPVPGAESVRPQPGHPLYPPGA